MIADAPDLTLPRPVPPVEGRSWGFLDLYFRPRRFFASPRWLHNDAIVAAAALLMGVFNATQRIDQKIEQARAGATGPMADFAAVAGGTWAHYWAFGAGIGLISAGLMWAVSGWWYGVRLGWSGAVAPDTHLARRVYALQAVICALPATLVKVAHTFAFPDPGAAVAAASDGVILLMGILPLWSCWTSYRAATTVFELKRSRALFWFLILPAVALYAGRLVVTLVVSALLH
jgi:hypothetical protein